MSVAIEIREPAGTARRLEPRPHEQYGGTPYYDEELGVAQNPAHRNMVVETGAILAALASELGLLYLSDEPVWYLHPENDIQRAYFGDCVLARRGDSTTVTAESLLVVMEVVTTHDRRKELKDTRFQRLVNEYNGVQEFVLLFPDVDDPRAVTWCRLVDGVYQEHAIAPGGSVQSSTVPGFELRVLPREAWTPGYKFDVYFDGLLRPRLAGERARAEAERERADAERERAERLAAKLRAMGIDPDA